MKVLIIEDSSRLRRSIRIGLKKIGFAVDEAADGLDGLYMAESVVYDAIILDLMLPEMDGLTVLKRLREKGLKTHILILSAKDGVEDRIRGLELGADDYLVKPFSFDELVARVNALIRRKYETKSPFLEIHGLEVDTASKKVFFEQKEVDVTAREFSLLEYLITRKGRVVTRDNLNNHLYSEEDLLTSNVVDVTICNLRKKLKQRGLEGLIKTRRGFGYVVE